MRNVLEQLPVDPRPDEFLVEVWEELRARETRRARRWRSIAAAATALALAALSAGVVDAVSSGSALDATVRCPVAALGGVPGFSINLSATTAPPASVGGKPFPALVDIASPGPPSLLAFDTAHAGYVIDRARCKATSRIPFTAARLPVTKVYRAGYFDGFRTTCQIGAPLIFRIKLWQDRDKVPTKAILAVRAGKRGTPIVYATWTPALVTVHATASSRCD